MKALGYFFTTVALIIVSAIYHGYALSKLWQWFIVPTFAAPALTITAAIGLGMVVEFMTRPMPKTDKEKPYSEFLLEGAVNTALKPTLALAIGSIVKIWM